MEFQKYVRGNVLDLYSNFWEPHDINIDELVTFLKKHPNITELFLDRCNVGDGGVEALAKTNLTSLNLKDCGIGDKAVEALAKFTNLTSLTLIKHHINVNRCTISTKGVKALATMNNLTSLSLMDFDIDTKKIEILMKASFPKLTSLSLTTKSIGFEDAEALAKFTYMKKIQLSLDCPMNCFTFYTHLIKAYSESNTVDNLDAESVKKMVFLIAPDNNDGQAIMHILKHPDKYPFLINSKNEKGLTLDHFYKHHIKTHKFLFEHGLIPTKDQGRDIEFENILQDNESVTSPAAVKKTNFITKNLVKFTKANRDELKQAAASYEDNIPKLLTLYQNNQVRLGLFSIPENEKRIVMRKTLNKHACVPDDKEFFKIVINRAEKALKELYLKKPQNCDDDGYATAVAEKACDRGDGKGKVTISESIGYVKLLIDKLTIPSEERKELLVTLAKKNPNLIKEKLSQIRLELGNSHIALGQITDRTEFYRLLNNIDDNKINKLFKEISGLDIEEIWREQKQIVLLEHIYVAATSNGEDCSACIDGTYYHIINSVSEIDSKLMDQYAEHLGKERMQEEQRTDAINAERGKEIAKSLTKELVEYVRKRPELRYALKSLSLAMINVAHLEEVTLEQQQILAKINQKFMESVRQGNIMGYSDNNIIPKNADYQMIINGFFDNKEIDTFIEEVTDKSEQTQQSSVAGEAPSPMAPSDNSQNETQNGQNPQITTNKPQGESNVYDNKGFGKEIMSVVGAIVGAIIGATIAYLAGAATLPIIAAIAVFSAVPGVLIGYSIAEICEKVSREKQNDPKMGILTALSVLTPKCLSDNDVVNPSLGKSRGA